MTVKTYPSFVPETEEWMMTVVLDDGYEVLICIDKGEACLVSYESDGSANKYKLSEFISGLAAATKELKDIIESETSN